MIQIYHNPRCSKSRQGLAILENSGKEFEVIKYLEDIPSEKEFKEVLKKLGISPIELVRKNEAIWKSDFKGKDLSDDELIQIMLEHPKLIERPIVVNNNKAVIGRPPEKIESII
ncbi:arsenate reductase (glutaredoxin) [Mangrovimonas sp. AS39]|uniref:arsenate reductase (glutaredoxin) n=1 Tax=Mangrovimonas TaxID=1211036 RepID=UPI00141EDAEB|nr:MULTISPECIES: arsenate reductase (glutaredoxin) [Mangrovimonas]MCF1191618.1 arsenate reductase (glutaredoxin) [Mangrovimonas futianensis]MCF1195494.1 arsenate reductase (glutaredoxin) [Mangrovimonas futianensis]NIK91955.1 arsenate reductase (glutaredoxin) [Mangrovimonas sp. CR14]